MIFSFNNYDNLKKEYNKQKRITTIVSLVFFAVIIMLIFIIFKFKLPYLAILGGIISFVLFVFINLRSHFVHKKIKYDTEFYSDVLYGEKQKDVVEFKGDAKHCTSNGRDFLSVEIYSYKEQDKNNLLIEASFPFMYKSGEKYLIERVGNILIDYKEYDNGKIC